MQRGSALSAALFVILLCPKSFRRINIVVAIVLGGSSGLTSIGANQMIRQLSKKEESNAQKQEENPEKEKDPAENNAPKKK